MTRRLYQAKQFAQRVEKLLFARGLPPAEALRMQREVLAPNAIASMQRFKRSNVPNRRWAERTKAVER
jgi:hypothetical protein